MAEIDPVKGRKKYRWFAYLLISLALTCLYPLGILIAQQVIQHKVTKILNQADVDGAWSDMSWRGRGLCFQLLKLRSRSQRWHLDAQSLCVRLTIKSEWPFMAAEDIYIDRPTIWLNLVNDDQQNIGRSVSQSYSVKDLASLQSWLDQADLLNKQVGHWERKVRQEWIKTWRLLARLGDHTLTLNDLKLSVQSSEMATRLSMSGNAILGSEHGEFVLNPFKWKGGWLETAAHFKLDSKGAQLLNMPRIKVAKDESITVHTPSSFKVTPQSLTLISTFKSPHLKELVKCVIDIPRSSLLSSGQRIAEFQCHELDRSEVRDQHNELTMAFLWSSEQPVADLKGSLSLTAMNNVFGRQSQSMIDKGLLKIHTRLPLHQDVHSVPIDMVFDQVTLRLPHLPQLDLPQIEIRFKLTPPKQWFHRTNPTHLSGQWKIENLWIKANRGGNHAVVNGDVVIEMKEGYLPDLSQVTTTLTLEEMSCQDLVDLTPNALFGPIKRLKVSGRLSPSLKATYQAPMSPLLDERSKRVVEPLKLKVRKLSRRCLFEEGDLLFLSRSGLTKRGRPLKIDNVTWMNSGFTFRVDPQYTEGKKVKVGPETSGFVPIEELPSYLGGAMYLTEETGFWRGGALSIPLITRAINTNLREGRFVYGGSTITQQLVKNLFLHRDKTLTRKFQEAVISALVVDHVSKQRVLELYLNMIEFGPNIFGIQAASKFYFQKDARDISPEEAVFLAMLKVSPKRGARWMKRGSSPRFTWWRKRSVQIFERLVQEGLITKKRARGAAPYILTWSDGVYQGVSRIEGSD